MSLWPHPRHFLLQLMPTPFVIIDGLQVLDLFRIWLGTFWSFAWPCSSWIQEFAHRPIRRERTPTPNILLRTRTCLEWRFVFLHFIVLILSQIIWKLYLLVESSYCLRLHRFQARMDSHLHKLYRNFLQSTYCLLSLACLFHNRRLSYRLENHRLRLNNKE